MQQQEKKQKKYTNTFLNVCEQVKDISVVLESDIYNIFMYSNKNFKYIDKSKTENNLLSLNAIQKNNFSFTMPIAK